MDEKETYVLRAPICTIVGHVDSGKTSLLDFLRNSKVTDMEDGGITQKIGITLLSEEYIKNITSFKKKLYVSGFMLIDTPGHECFTNQRLCGIEISDLVIMVIDIFKGIEKQTIECIKLLRKNKVPFLVAVNKLDRISEWKSVNNENLKTIFKKQKKQTIKRLDKYLTDIIVQFAENSLNAQVYYKNKNQKDYISLVPVSAKTGEGIPDLLLLINMLSNKFLNKQLIIKQDITDGFIVEKIKDPKYGNLLASILTNGELKSGDSIITFDSYNNIVERKVTHIYVTEENIEIKDKISLNLYPSVKASVPLAIKLDIMDRIMTGCKMFKFSNDKEKQKYVNILLKIKKNPDFFNKEFHKPGILLNAPTNGTLTALYNLCSSNNIPIAGASVGPVTKADIFKGSAILSQKFNDLEDKIYYNRFSVILAYDVNVPNDIQNYANSEKVSIISNKIIYRLLEQYKKYIDDLNHKIIDLYPEISPKCKLIILKQFVFMKKNPILIGVKIIKNILKKGMIIKASTSDKTIILGQVIGIHKNKKDIDEASENEEVCIRIEPIDDKKYEYGKDFDYKFKLSSSFTEKEMKVIEKYGDIFGI